jgi:2-phosphosulfolactate phosphatase
MKISVIPFASAVKQEQVEGKTVVVIDVLRATTVMITALSNGAKEVIPLETIEEARAIYHKMQDPDMLLCGERNAGKIEGFHLGNSPLEYTNSVVENRSLVLTTTNGTKALKACIGAKEVFIGAFLNLYALVQAIHESEEVVIVCSGTKDRFSLDDGLCAALIISELASKMEIAADDLGHVLLNCLHTDHQNLKDTLKTCSHLNFLIENGYGKDVDFCLQLNTIKIVPIFTHDTVRLRS